MSKKSFSEEREKHLAELCCKLDAARDLSVKEIAARVREIGFECIHCGECCCGEDNSVVVFPFEIRRILAATGDSWLQTVKPPLIGEWDCKGHFHTLEWRVKKDGRSCKFYVGKCKIYDVRPILCSTYPFYMDDGILRFSECRGLGRKIGIKESEEIAVLLIERYLTETLEAIALLEKYEDFERGLPSKNGACIVHDSEGLHRISWKHLD